MRIPAELPTTFGHPTLRLPTDILHELSESRCTPTPAEGVDAGRETPQKAAKEVNPSAVLLDISGFECTPHLRIRLTTIVIISVTWPANPVSALLVKFQSVRFLAVCSSIG